MAQKLLLLTLITLIASTPLLIQPCNAQPTTLEDKATSFLSDVIQLDLSRYKLTLDPQYTEIDKGHLFYNLYANDDLFSTDHGIIVFNFEKNGSLTQCTISPGLKSLVYTHPDVDRFNATSGILQRYQLWSNDSQAQRMVELLKRVSEEKDAFEADGNLSLRISVYPNELTTYQFSNYFDGVEYSYVSIAIADRSNDIFFSDTRASQKIGNTTLSISKSQAIAIATEAVKEYSYNHTFGNGTSIILKDFKVTGVYDVGLSSALKENMTLYPLYDVQMNVTSLPSRAIGLGVKIWADDGTVQAVYLYVYPGDGAFTDLWNAIFVFPMMLSTVASLAFVIVILVLVVAVLLIVVRKNKTKSG
jgi:hypothetical protein